MELRTARLRIRDLEEGDRSAVVAWRSDPEVMRLLDNPDGLDPDGWFDGRLRTNARRPRDSYDAAIVESATGQTVGWIGIAWSYDVAGDVVIGYAVRRESWGRGYAPEAVQAVLAFCFTELQARSAYAECYVANVRSARVMEKAGMRRAGETTSFDPTLGPSVRYVATKDDWRPPRRRRLGLTLVLAMLALIVVPAGIGTAVEWATSSPRDDRLLPWPARGELVDDTDVVAQAELAWRQARPSRNGPGADVQVVWAGRTTDGEGTVVLLQSVGPDGKGRLAQLTPTGPADGWRLDRDEVIDPATAAVVVTYDRSVPSFARSDSSRPAPPPAVQLVLAPDLLGVGPRATELEAHRMTELRRRRPVVWEPLEIRADGITSAWQDYRRTGRGTFDGETLVVLSRPASGDAAHVLSVAARADTLMGGRPEIGLADPTWGARTPLDLSVFDDAMVARTWLGPRISGEIAPLAVLAYERYRVSILEVRSGRERRAVLVARSGTEVGCLTERRVDLRRHAVVVLTCRRPWAAPELAGVVARPGVTRLEIVAEGAAPMSLANSDAHAFGRTSPAAGGVVRVFRGEEKIGEMRY
ncbi:MAG TPA: GNAT family N-acetyltransferase [Actinopolymorphaceae bacterium]